MTLLVGLTLAVLFVVVVTVGIFWGSAIFKTTGDEEDEL